MLQMAGLKAEHVPFRGAAPALTDVVAGHLHFMVTTLPSVVGLMTSNAVLSSSVFRFSQAVGLSLMPRMSVAVNVSKTCSTVSGRVQN